MDKVLSEDFELNDLYQRELVRLKLGDQILRLRRSLGLSQAKLAQLIGRSSRRSRGWSATTTRDTR